MIPHARSALLLLGAIGGLAASGNAVAALPDGRGLELVTPGADKGGGEIAPRYMQISPDGGRIAFTVNGVFGDDPTHGMTVTGTSTAYVAERGAAGWRSAFRSRFPLPVPVSQNVFDLALMGASKDLSRLFYNVTYGPATGLTPGLWVDPSNGTGELLAAQPPVGNAPRFVGTSADGSHVAIWVNSNGALTPVPGNPAMTGPLLYESVDGTPRLVNVDGGGNVLNTAGGTFASTVGANGGSGGSSTTIRNAITEDGSRIFFHSKEPGAGFSDPNHLYVRIDGASTVQLSASEHSLPQPAPAEVTFAGASDDGTKAFFTTTGQLTDDAVGAGPFLYQYELPIGASSGTLSLVAGVDHPVRVSTNGWAVPQVRVAGDGSRVYFSSDDDGGSIYVHETASGTTEPVAVGVGATRLQTVMESGGSMLDFADLSYDGRHLVFITSADLVPEDVSSGRQIYAYDAGTRALRLVSGGPGAPAAFDAEFVANDGSTASLWMEGSPPLGNYVSDDGRYVFFETKAGLVPEDNNGTMDVYREKDGTVELVSSGIALLPTYLVGASADGESIFVLTANDLLPQDGDDSWDVYVARVGGGFPLPSRPDPCVADACQPPMSQTPFLPIPATAGFAGPGNVEDPATADATFSVAKVSAAAKRTLARTGKVTVVVRTSDAGMVAAKLSARLGKRWASVDTAVGRTSKAGRVRLRMTLSPKAKTYLRKHKRGMSVRIDVTYSASDEGRRAAFVVRPSASKRGAR